MVDAEKLTKLIFARGVLEIHERRVREKAAQARKYEEQANALLRKAAEAICDSSAHRRCAESRRSEIAELESEVHSHA